jgi:class 3 adenylate cyclase
MSSKDEIDVILLDIVMPEMNGYEVLKFIKNDKRFYELPVIMISSMDDTDSIYRCIEIGADDYITKPFKKSILDARITSCIEKKHLRDKEKSLLLELEKERDKSENLLLNILPQDIAQRLKSGETDIASKHENVSVLFADIINFTPQTKDLSPSKVVHILNDIFSAFDDLARKLNIEKIKTIGDSYFAVGGLHTDDSEGAVNIMELAKEMINAIHYINKNTVEMELQIRIGVHTGPAVAGVIGKNKFAYDLWGATINMANRLETTCPSSGGIHISESTKVILKDKYKYQLCTNTEIKGIGKINTYLIV